LQKYSAIFLTKSKTKQLFCKNKFLHQAIFAPNLFDAKIYFGVVFDLCVFYFIKNNKNTASNPFLQRKAITLFFAPNLFLQ